MDQLNLNGKKKNKKKILQAGQILFFPLFSVFSDETRFRKVIDPHTR